MHSDYHIFQLLQAKEAIVTEANDEGTELMGEHASLAQTLSLKSVVGKFFLKNHKCNNMFHQAVRFKQRKYNY